MQDLAFEQLDVLEREHWWFRGRRRVYLSLLEQLLERERPRRALDLGSGLGGFVEQLGTRCESVVALDTDARGLSACRARGASAALRARSEALPFAGASFDLVCLFDMLEHTDDDALVLREVTRVLRPGGLCFLSVPAWPCLYAENDRVAQHRRRYRRPALASLCRTAGLEVERNTYTNALLFPLIAPAVLLLKAWETCVPSARGDGHTNLSWSPPNWVNELCYRAFSAELALSRHADLPLGHSIALAARRPTRATIRTGSYVPASSSSTRPGKLTP